MPRVVAGRGKTIPEHNVVNTAQQNSFLKWQTAAVGYFFLSYKTFLFQCLGLDPFCLLQQFNVDILHF